VAKREARVLDAGGPAATVNPERLSVFQRVADRVSYGMGTPQNIIFWIIAVALWVAAGPYIAQHPFLPDRFTSNSFNFPLNTVTTILELYIGFLVGASGNRSERNLEATLGRLGAQEQQIADVEQKLATALTQNTELTKEIHELTKLIHEKVSAS
jgi:low affinity Fe/Cu permease